MHRPHCLCLCFLSDHRHLCLAAVYGGQGVHRSHLHAERDSHACYIGPGRESVQVKHGFAPGVNGQRDAKDANDVHKYSSLSLVEKKNIQGFFLFLCIPEVIKID